MSWLSRLFRERAVRPAESEAVRLAESEAVVEPQADQHRLDSVDLTVEQRRQIAAEIRDAERVLGASHWVEGNEIARSYGVSVFDIHDEYMALLDKENADRDVIDFEVIEVPADRVRDLRSVESMRMRVRGVSYRVGEDERADIRSTEYVLFRDRENEHDPSAVAVLTPVGRKIGYVPASRAAMLAPLLDEIGTDWFRVDGALPSDSDGSLWTSVPKVPALRASVDSLREQ